MPAVFLPPVGDPVLQVPAVAALEPPSDLCSCPLFREAFPDYTT